MVQGDGGIFRGDRYHARCFNCGVCSESLVGADLAIVMDGKPACRKHASSDQAKGNVAAQGQTCAKCNANVTTAAIQSEDALYHEHCFTCTTCDKSLIGEGYLMSPDTHEPFCETCYHEAHGLKCDKCGLPILPEVGSTS